MITTETPPSILPTRRCFDDAVDIIERIVVRGGRKAGADLRLVHAICLVPGTEDEFSHGWAENTRHKTVMFRGILLGQLVNVTRSIAEHYAELRPKCITKYTVRELLRENRKHGTYGPWKREYLDLCERRKACT